MSWHSTNYTKEYNEAMTNTDDRWQGVQGAEPWSHQSNSEQEEVKLSGMHKEEKAGNQDLT